MHLPSLILAVSTLLALIGGPTAHAHRPFFANGQYGDQESSFAVTDPAESIVVNHEISCDRQDLWLQFEGVAGQEVFVQAGVPQIERLERLPLSIALVGPGFDDQAILRNSDSDIFATPIEQLEPRKEFRDRESATDSWVYFEQTVTLPETGTYYLVGWPTTPQTGKFWLSMGTEERFTELDYPFFPMWIAQMEEFYEVEGQTKTSEEQCDWDSSVIPTSETDDSSGLGACSAGGGTSGLLLTMLLLVAFYAKRCGILSLLFIASLACGSEAAGTPQDASPQGASDGAPSVPPADANPAMVSTNFEDPGAFSVSVSSDSILNNGCNLSYSLYQPSGAQNPPLVLLGHGFQKSGANQEELARHLASYGVRVATPDFCHSQTFDADHVANGEDAAALVATLKDDSPVIFIGHSAGGISALVGASMETSTVAAMGLDLTDLESQGANAANSFSGSILGLVGTPNSCNSSGNGRPIFSGANRQGYLLPGAGHCDFEAPTDFICTSFCGNAEPNRQRLVFALATAFTMFHFGLDASGESWISETGDDLQRLVAEGRIELL